MAKTKKATVALQGHKHECELIKIVNNTAIIILDGKKVMASVSAITPINAEARRMLGIEEEPPKKKAAPKKKKSTAKKTSAKEKKEEPEE